MVSSLPDKLEADTTELRLSAAEKDELIRLFQRSQMEQNMYKIAQQALENPQKMQQIAMLFAFYKSLDYKSFDRDGTPHISLQFQGRSARDQGHQMSESTTQAQGNKQNVNLDSTNVCSNGIDQIKIIGKSTPDFNIKVQSKQVIPGFNNIVNKNVTINDAINIPEALNGSVPKLPQNIPKLGHVQKQNNDLNKHNLDQEQKTNHFGTNITVQMKYDAAQQAGQNKNQEEFSHFDKNHWKNQLKNNIIPENNHQNIQNTEEIKPDDQLSSDQQITSKKYNDQANQKDLFSDQNQEDKPFNGLKNTISKNEKHKTALSLESSIEGVCPGIGSFESSYRDHTARMNEVRRIGTEAEKQFNYQEEMKVTTLDDDDDRMAGQHTMRTEKKNSFLALKRPSDQIVRKSRNLKLTEVTDRTNKQLVSTQKEIDQVLEEEEDDVFVMVYGKEGQLDKEAEAGRKDCSDVLQIQTIHEINENILDQRNSTLISSSIHDSLYTKPDNLHSSHVKRTIDCTKEGQRLITVEGTFEEDPLTMRGANPINISTPRRQALTSQPRARLTMRNGQPYEEALRLQSIQARERIIEYDIQMKRQQLKSLIIDALRSNRSSSSGLLGSPLNDRNIDQINWRQPSDAHLLFLMQMQVLGLDAHGDQLIKPDSQLIAVSNLYLQRQNMLPNNQYLMLGPDPEQLRQSVYFKYYQMDDINKGPAEIENKYKVTKLKAFNWQVYRKEKQQQQLKKILQLQKNIEVALKGANSEMKDRLQFYNLDQNKLNIKKTMGSRQSQISGLCLKQANQYTKLEDQNLGIYFSEFQSAFSHNEPMRIIEKDDVMFINRQKKQELEPDSDIKYQKQTQNVQKERQVQLKSPQNGTKIRNQSNQGLGSNDTKDQEQEQSVNRLQEQSSYANEFGKVDNDEQTISNSLKQSQAHLKSSKQPSSRMQIRAPGLNISHIIDNSQQIQQQPGQSYQNTVSNQSKVRDLAIEGKRINVISADQIGSSLEQIQKFQEFSVANVNVSQHNISQNKVIDKKKKSTNILNIERIMVRNSQDQKKESIVHGGDESANNLKTKPTPLESLLTKQDEDTEWHNKNGNSQNLKSLESQCEANTDTNQNTSHPITTRQQLQPNQEVDFQFKKVDQYDSTLSEQSHKQQRLQPVANTNSNFTKKIDESNQGLIQISQIQTNKIKDEQLLLKQKEYVKNNQKIQGENIDQNIQNQDFSKDQGSPSKRSVVFGRHQQHRFQQLNLSQQRYKEQISPASVKPSANTSKNKQYELNELQDAQKQQLPKPTRMQQETNQTKQFKKGLTSHARSNSPPMKESSREYRSELKDMVKSMVLSSPTASHHHNDEPINPNIYPEIAIKPQSGTPGSDMVLHVIQTERVQPTTEAKIMSSRREYETVEPFKEKMAEVIKMQREYLDLKNQMEVGLFGGSVVVNHDVEGSQREGMVSEERGYKRNGDQVQVVQSTWQSSQQQSFPELSIPQEYFETLEAKLQVGLNLFNLPIDITILENPAFMLDQDKIMQSLIENTQQNALSSLENRSITQQTFAQPTQISQSPIKNVSNYLNGNQIPFENISGRNQSQQLTSIIELQQAIKTKNANLQNFITQNCLQKQTNENLINQICNRGQKKMKKQQRFKFLGYRSNLQPFQQKNKQSLSQSVDFTNDQINPMFRNTLQIPSQIVKPYQGHEFESILLHRNIVQKEQNRGIRNQIPGSSKQVIRAGKLYEQRSHAGDGGVLRSESAYQSTVMAHGQEVGRSGFKRNDGQLSSDIGVDSLRQANFSSQKTVVSPSMKCDNRKDFKQSFNDPTGVILRNLHRIENAKSKTKTKFENQDITDKPFNCSANVSPMAGDDSLIVSQRTGQSLISSTRKMTGKFQHTRQLTLQGQSQND